MNKPPEPKKAGRPALPPELKRTARISTRTYPDVAAKVARNGTEWLEAVIRKAKDAPLLERIYLAMAAKRHNTRIQRTGTGPLE